MWVWQRKYVIDPWERILMLDFCRSHGISKILVQVHLRKNGANNYEFRDSRSWNELLKMAKGLGIQIEALDGANNMAFAENHADTIARLQAVLDFNNSQPNTLRFSGIHYDIEPYSTSRWRSGDQQKIALELLELLVKLRKMVNDGDSSLTFANDIPFWYDDKQQLYFEFNGSKKYLNEHIQDISDYIGVMSYRTKMTGENSTASISSRELAYGAKIGRPVYLAIETIALPNTPDITFYGQEAIAVASAVRELSESLKDNPSFGGVFLHEYRALRQIDDQWELSEINN